MGDFFAFRKMVTPILIKILFVLGLIALVVAGFYFAEDTDGFSLLIIIPGFLALRMICESAILLFSMHEELVKANNTKAFNRNGSINDWGAPQNTAPPPNWNAPQHTAPPPNWNAPQHTAPPPNWNAPPPAAPPPNWNAPPPVDQTAPRL